MTDIAHGLSTRSRSSDLSPENVERMKRLVPDEPVRLPAGPVFACDMCGQATVLPAGTEPTIVQAFSRAGEPPRPPGPRPELEARFARCPDCLARTALARALVRKFPSMSARWGPWGAEVKVEHTLAALTILGIDLPDPERVTAQHLGSLIFRLAAPGSSCSWSGEFSPVMTKPAGACAPRPWAGVSMSTRLACRTGYAATLADRVAAGAPEHRLPPPEPVGTGIHMAGACLFCGVGHVVRTAAQVGALGTAKDAQREVWTAVAAPPSALGGPGSPQALVGYCCPPCAEAVERVGAIGPTAMERALAAYLRSTGREDDALRVERGDVRVTAWGAAAWSARRRNVTFGANDQPWGHQRLS